MDIKPMKILIIEDDAKECKKFVEIAKTRNDIEIVAMTDSDMQALQDVKVKHPEGIVLDIELNNGKNGSTDGLSFLENLKKINLNYKPIIIVTTHVNSDITYDILHRNGVELILYKGHPNYSNNLVFNRFLSLRKENIKPTEEISIQNLIFNEEKAWEECLEHELDLVGIPSKMKGRQYIFDAVMYLLKNENSTQNVLNYVSKIYNKSATTINNGIENAIKHGWDVSAVEDLEKYYTNTIDSNRGYPTPMELIYFYVNKVKRMA